MLFNKQFVQNSAVAKLQLSHRDASRNAFAINEAQHQQALVQHGLALNSGLIPQDVYQDFDNVTIERMRSDDGDTFLNDLMPLSRGTNIGKLTLVSRRASDAGQVQTSMSGQTGVKFDQVEYNYDRSLIPVHDAGFTRNWREWAAMQSEDFDALIDDQRENVAAVRRRLADTFLDGHRDKKGNLIVGPDNTVWAGFRNDARVNQVDLGAGGLNFDFTDNTKTGEEIKAAFIQIRDVLWITNNCEKDAVYYVSRQIASNFERKFSTQYDAKIIMQELADLMGVEAIKVSSKLSGNELMAFPLDGMVRPLTGMGVSTIALPRPLYNSNYDFVTAAAIGWEVKTDYFSKSCALYASA